ncbi:MAG: MlaC/ttg2D family ABC transporter substrate-binding protein [Gammaproteobacteria bacterium]
MKTISTMAATVAGAAIALSALLAAAPAAAQGSAAVPAETPSAVVRRTVDGVIAVLETADIPDAARKRRVRAVIAEHFDFAAMANRVLATNWRKASRAQRQRFTGLFRELLSNTYWRRISAYSNEKVEVTGERMRSDALATVTTLIRTDTADIPVDYKLYLREGRWFAYDVVIEQVSLVRNYRGSFQEIVRDKGIDGLIGELELKVAESSVEEE